MIPKAVAAAAAAAAAAAKSLQSCPTLCDPIDSSPPGSPVPGILQARTLEWVAISFSNEMYIFSYIRIRSRCWKGAKHCGRQNQLQREYLPSCSSFCGASTHWVERPEVTSSLFRLLSVSLTTSFSLLPGGGACLFFEGGGSACVRARFAKQAIIFFIFIINTFTVYALYLF